MAQALERCAAPCHTCIYMYMYVCVLHVQNLILVNECSETLIWNPDYAISIKSASNTWLLPRSRYGPATVHGGTGEGVVIMLKPWERTFSSCFKHGNPSWAAAESWLRVSGLGAGVKTMAG